MVVVLALAIVSRGSLVQSRAFLDCRTFAFKALLHSFSFLLYFLPPGTRFLEILFAEALYLWRSRSSLYFDLITKRLQLLCETRSIDRGRVLLAVMTILGDPI